MAEYWKNRAEHRKGERNCRQVNSCGERVPEFFGTSREALLACPFAVVCAWRMGWYLFS